jgi:hypothetical protein
LPKIGQLLAWVIPLQLPKTSRELPLRRAAEGAAAFSKVQIATIVALCYDSGGIA